MIHYFQEHDSCERIDYVDSEKVVHFITDKYYIFTFYNIIV